jgi:hypothetical protein
MATDDQRGADIGEIDDPLLDAVKEHPALAITGGVTALAAAQVLIMARGDVPTALAIVSSETLPTILTATVVSVLPALALAVAINAVLAAELLYRAERRAVLTLQVAILVSLLALLITPIALIGVLGVIGFLGVRGVQWWHRRRGQRIVWRGGLSPASLAFLVYLLALNALVADTWLPLERIETRTGAVIGYAMATEGGFTSVLVDRPRYVSQIPEDDVRARTLCERREDWYTLSILDVARLASPPPAAPCER